MDMKKLSTLLDFQNTETLRDFHRQFMYLKKVLYWAGGPATRKKQKRLWAFVQTKRKLVSLLSHLFLRLDFFLVLVNFVSSGEQARYLIKSGNVRVNGKVNRRLGFLVSNKDCVTLSSYFHSRFKYKRLLTLVPISELNTFLRSKNAFFGSFKGLSDLLSGSGGELIQIFTIRCLVKSFMYLDLAWVHFIKYYNQVGWEHWVSLALKRVQHIVYIYGVWSKETELLWASRYEELFKVRNKLLLLHYRWNLLKVSCWKLPVSFLRVDLWQLSRFSSLFHYSFRSSCVYVCFPIHVHSILFSNCFSLSDIAQLAFVL